MPFGVTNAPVQFMFMMNDLLGEYLDKFVIVFLDDVLIYSANPQDHVDHLRKVLGRLRHHHLYSKASKCDIMKKSVEFLGSKFMQEAWHLQRQSWKPSEIGQSHWMSEIYAPSWVLQTTTDGSSGTSQISQTH